MTIIILAFFCQGCMALQVRQPLPENLLDQAQVDDMPGDPGLGGQIE